MAKALNTQSAVVHLVDDDPAVLRLLQATVASIGIDARSFASAKDFLAAYRPAPSECLVCDLRMPDIDGMELQRRLQTMAFSPPLIFLTGYAEVDVAVAAMKLGAFDFLQKPFSTQALLGKIQAALEHSRGQYAQAMAQRAQEARLALLTPRERGVLNEVVVGKSSREIAAELGLSPRTVENHRTRIMEKLHAESTVELVKLLL